MSMQVRLACTGLTVRRKRINVTILILSSCGVIWGNLGVQFGHLYLNKAVL